MTKQEIETPALVVDLDRMELNLKRMADFFQNVPAKLRPHFKNHKSTDLAKRQLAAGAIGVTCATVYEAECLAEQGVRDILLANEIVEPAKIRRVVALARQTEIIVCVDSEKACEALARAARDAQMSINVLVDVDMGMHRCGVQPGEPAVRLAGQAMDLGLRFRGLMGYEGHVLHLPPGAAKNQAVEAALRPLVETGACLESRGVAVDIVSVGGTGTYSVSGCLPGVTEVQAGSYLLMDTTYRQCCTDFELALTVLATVVSANDRGHVVVDAGVKAMSCERGIPAVKDQPGLAVRKVNAEHAIIDVREAAAPPRIGDKLEFWVCYSDATVNLHHQMYGVRNGQVVEIFEVCGPGCW